MRHHKTFADDSYRQVDMAAAWPAATRPAPAVADAADQGPADAAAPTPSAPDVPVAAGAMLAAAYFALIAAFALVTAGSAPSIFAIAICALFVAIFFAVPFVFLAIEPGHGRRVGLGEFMRGGMETLTGHSSGAAALVQMMIVPVLLTLGVLAIGIAEAALP